MSPRTHSDFQDLLEKHISGDTLAPEARMDLFDHIETCDECRFMLEAEERVTARMKSVPRLVAPSDLRSKILSQAMRDHQERTTAPSEDPVVSDVLKRTPHPPKLNAAKLRQQAAALDDYTENDLPVFSGITRPRPSRLRRAWRRSSPAVATGFLVISSVGALYTGQFQGIPVAGQAQQKVWARVDSAIGKQNPYAPPPDAPAPAPLERQMAPIAVAEADAAAATLPPSTPLPGTEILTGMVMDLHRWAASADSTVAALARASEGEVPMPAEQATPQIAALVLRPTDRDNSPGGFRESELAAALEAMAETQPGGQLTHQDQFAMDGHRYRMYTLNLPAGATSRMVETLTPYQAPTDGGIVNVLASQNQVNVSRNASIRFFASNEQHLRTAIQQITPVSTSDRSESIRIVVVE